MPAGSARRSLRSAGSACPRHPASPAARRGSGGRCRTAPPARVCLRPPDCAALRIDSGSAMRRFIRGPLSPGPLPARDRWARSPRRAPSRGGRCAPSPAPGPGAPSRAPGKLPRFAAAPESRPGSVPNPRPRSVPRGPESSPRSAPAMPESSPAGSPSLVRGARNSAARPKSGSRRPRGRALRCKPCTGRAANAGNDASRQGTRCGTGAAGHEPGPGTRAARTLAASGRRFDQWSIEVPPVHRSPGRPARAAAAARESSPPPPGQSFAATPPGQLAASPAVSAPVTKCQ